MKGRLLKIFIVVGGAMFFSTIGIFASDALRGVTPGLGNLAAVQGIGACKSGSIEFKGPNGLICVDLYEASPSNDCPHPTQKNTIQTEQNLNSPNCFAVSEKEKKPWTFITLSQAQRACALVGKRLPTNEEWYRIALGTQIDSCVVKSPGPQGTGTLGCLATSGVHDMVGNVWEWVDESVINNEFNGRILPETGYVTNVDADGIALSSGLDPDELYGKDYFWSKSEGVSGMIRGGFYDSGSDAGLYTTNASVPTNFATQGVGFRCVEDVI